MGSCTLAEKDKDPFEILRDALLSVGRSAAMASDGFYEFSKLDVAAIHQQYADALGKSVDGLTDDEKRQAIMDTVLSDA